MFSVKVLLVSLVLTTQLYASNVEVKVFTHESIKQFESLIMQQRQDTFSQFPYLMWQGNEFEHLYATLYTKNFYGALAIAYKDGAIAGFLTGCPLEAFDAEWVKYGCDTISDQLESELNVKTNYYFGDVIVLEQYRGQRIADELFEALELHAQSLGFDTVSFITVIRDDGHPQMPSMYISPTKIWERLGYRKTGKYIVYDWPTFQPNGLLQNQRNACDIWIKQMIKEEK